MEGARRTLSFSIIKILGTEKAVCSSEEFSSPCTATNTSGIPVDDRGPSDCPSCNELELDSRGEPEQDRGAKEEDDDEEEESNRVGSKLYPGNNPNVKRQ
ncbi:hypothetical protein GBAR_LOCUS28616, partial [Geodia barretti]